MKQSEEKKKSNPWKKVFSRGLAALLPTIATIALLYLLLNFFYVYAVSPITSLLRWGLERISWGNQFLTDNPFLSELTLVAAGLLIAMILFAGLGLLVHGLFGKKIFAAFEEGLLQLPGVRAIYPHAKQVVEFFFDKKRPAFQAVVAVPYPHPDIYSLAFVTSDGLKTLNEKTKETLVSVFIPSSPMPVTGWIAFISIEKVIPLSMPVDDALRFMVSAGLILPESEQVLLGKKSLLGSKESK